MKRNRHGGIYTEFIPNGKVHYEHYRSSCLWTSCGMPANFAMVTNLLNIPKTSEDIAEVTCGSCKISKRYIKKLKQLVIARLSGKD